MISFDGNEKHERDITEEKIEDSKEDRSVKDEEYRKISQYNDCKVHCDKKQDMFCKTCEEPICERCAYLNHREKKHKIIDIWDVIHEKEKQFSQQTNILKFQIQPTYQQAILNMETEFKEMAEIYNQTKRKIKITAEEWQRIVEDFIKRNLKNVVKMEEAYRTHLCEEKSKREYILTQIENMVEENERLLGNPVELVEKEVPKIEKFKRFPSISRVDPPVFYVVTLQEVVDHQIKQEKSLYYDDLHDLHNPYDAAFNSSCVCLGELRCLRKRTYPEYEILTGIATRPRFDNLPVQIPKG